MLKKETRILGISAPLFPKRGKTTPIVGVVYRGNLWLDGILTCSLRAQAPKYLEMLASRIIHSKHYSQIRCVVLSRQKLVQGADVDIERLSRMIKLPVLSVIGAPHVRDLTKRQGKPTAKPVKLNCYTIAVGGTSVRVAGAGLNRSLAQEVFTVGCAEGQSIPEAVRVADLIANIFQTAFSSPRASNA